ncbi:MAG: DMT family transporter [Flavobacteriaceae bacterium]|nr:DMT family transporter [Flavobacteriaceae bacterium]
MFYLIASILIFTLIFVVFKLYDRFKIDILQAIVVNYIVAFITSMVAYKYQVGFDDLSVSKIVGMDWFYYTFGLGTLFIIVFIFIAKTTQVNGLSVASVATKMSVIIPIIFGLVYYKESLGILKIIGILFALMAVYFVSVKSKVGLKLSKRDLVLPLLVLIGSGIIDTTIKFLEEAYVAENDISIFSATIFLSAAVLGIFLLIYKSFKGVVTIELKNIIGGIALGIPNYFSIFFLVKALRSDLLESSGIFTINNVSIVTLSTLVGIVFFREKLLPKNWLGIVLAILSIVLIAL